MPHSRKYLSNPTHSMYSDFGGYGWPSFLRASTTNLLIHLLISAGSVKFSSSGNSQPVLYMQADRHSLNVFTLQLVFFRVFVLSVDLIRLSMSLSSQNFQNLSFRFNCSRTCSAVTGSCVKLKSYSCAVCVKDNSVIPLKTPSWSYKSWPICDSVLSSIDVSHSLFSISRKSTFISAIILCRLQMRN